MVITEISPFDVDTPTTFMCEYHFKTDEEKELAGEAEVERCFCARTHNSFEEGGGGEPRMQRSVSELDSSFEAFAATRSQRAAADKKAGGEATANEPSRRDPERQTTKRKRTCGKEVTRRRSTGH